MPADPPRVPQAPSPDAAALPCKVHSAPRGQQAGAEASRALQAPAHLVSGTAIELAP